MTRNFSLPGRSPVLGTEAAIATSHPFASQTGWAVLRAGGNAVDAGLAAVAVLGIAEPHMTGVGGDCFALYLPRGASRPIALNGSGRAPRAADAARLRAAGLDAIAPSSADAVTVPGAVAAWCRLATDHGRWGLDAVLQPAIDAAERGVPVAPRVARDWALDAHLLRDPVARAIFLQDGLAPPVGTVHRQPRMAETLRAVARDGHAGFYGGWVADDLVATLRRHGGVHTLDDFADTEPEVLDAISTDYRGHTVHECPPNGQGLAVLMMLNVLSGFAPGDLLHSEADRIHLLAEVAKQAYLHRDALFCDPRHADVPTAHLLSSAWAERHRSAIRMDRAGAPTVWPSVAHEDTVYVSVVDRDGNALSLINSIFHPFGSTIAALRSGVLLHNRGAGFSLAAGHPNELVGGKRPMHTIIPGLLTAADGSVAPFGVMGGQYQACGQVALLVNLLDGGLDMQAALDAPRSFAHAGVLDLEDGHTPSVDADLRARGHVVTRSGTPIGGGQIIWRDARSGVLWAGSDPRKDGCALAQ